MIYIYYDNKEFENQIKYTFSTFFQILGIQVEFISSLSGIKKEFSLIINYSDSIINLKKVINIKPSYLFSDKYFKLESMPKIPLKRYNNIPAIYIYNNQEAYIKKEVNTISTNIDIVQSSFFMLTRYEEVLLWDKIKKDMYDRFPSKESLAHKEDFLNIPIVNKYIEWLWNWINSFNLGYKRRNIWGKYNFAACLTHDVDTPFKYTYSFKKDIQNLKTKKTYLAYRDILLHTLSNLDYKKDAYFTFDYIRSIEKKYNFASSFYFMSGGTSNYDNSYKIDDIRIVNLINALDKENCEIGYHYSYNSYNDYELRKNEKKILDKYVNNKNYGGRNHYLRFKASESWDIGEKLELLYDTTLTYADYSGFRCGMCIPYKPFDILQNRELNIWEIPLIVMEGTLKDKRYMNLNCSEAIEEIRNKINIVKKYNGVFTLLWHNSSFDKDAWSGWNKVFEKTIDYIYKENGLGISGKKVIDIISEKEIK